MRLLARLVARHRQAVDRIVLVVYGTGRVEALDVVVYSFRVFWKNLGERMGKKVEYLPDYLQNNSNIFSKP